MDPGSTVHDVLIRSHWDLIFKVKAKAVLVNDDE